MCKKQKGLHNRIDKCMKPLIEFLNYEGYKTVACCCGHGKYPMSIIIERQWHKQDIISKKVFNKHRKKFYRKDKLGYYYIPEVVNEKKN